MYENIYNMALEGKTNKEISELTGYNEWDVARQISLLSNPQSKYYNLHLYEKIIFVRAVKNDVVINKDLLEEIITFINNGFTFLEIAILNQTTIVNIKEQLSILNKKTSKYYYPESYKKLLAKALQNDKITEEDALKRLQQLEQLGYNLDCNQSNRLVKKYNYYKLVKVVVESYVKSNGTLNTIDMKTKYNSFFYEIFNLKSMALVEKLVGRQMALQFQELRIQQKAIKTKATVTNKRQININSFTSNIEFWFKIWFTYHLSLSQLAKLANCNYIQEMKKALLYYAKDNKMLMSALYLIANPSFDSKNYNQALNYLNKLFQAKNNPLLYDELLSQIDDRQYYQLIDRNKSKEELSAEDVKIILEYRKKYFLLKEQILANSTKFADEEYLNIMKNVREFKQEYVYNHRKRG